jgi:small subunit ribosomal protein S8
MQDPISDMLTRIRNGLHSNKRIVSIPLSKQKKAIAEVLFQEGYIGKLSISSDSRALEIELKYHNGKPVIDLLKRVSKPSLRVYRPASNLPKVYGGYGISIVSTSKGLMSDRNALSQRIGGEVICYIA